LTPPSSTTRRWLLSSRAFDKSLKQRKGKDYKPRSKRVCYRCGKFGHFIAKCPYTSASDDDKKGKKKLEKKRYYNKKKGGEAHMGWEWDSDESSTDSSNEDAANIAINKGLLFPTSATNASWLRMAKRRRYILEIPPNILYPMMRVALVMIMKMI
jgi:hypothetical protein